MTLETLLRDDGRILFIGNSLVFSAGGVNNAFEALARSAGRLVVQSAETVGGYCLRQHLERLQTMAALTSGSWDVVVLHDYSNGPIKDREGFFKAGAALAEIARTHGAKPVLYMTWAYREDYDGMTVAGGAMTRALAQAYSALGAKIGAPVAPAGLAFQNALDKGIDLYSDLRHQNEAGTYLVACVFYGFLFGRSPVGLPFTHGLSQSGAAVLQQIAWQTLSGETEGAGAP